METPENTLVPRPLRIAGGKALQQLMNRALVLDPDSAARVQALRGQSVQLHLDGPDLALRVRVDEARHLQVGPPHEITSLRVRTTPGVVLAMALDSRHEVGPGKLEIAGDAGLARQLEALLKDWQPDLEALLSARLGDVLGVGLAQAAIRATDGARRLARHAREDAAAFVRDEARLTPSRGEVDAWLDEVDAVAEACERLEHRIGRLERGP